jgi:hypothetical protein
VGGSHSCVSTVFSGVDRIKRNILKCFAAVPIMQSPLFWVIKAKEGTLKQFGAKYPQTSLKVVLVNFIFCSAHKF